PRLVSDDERSAPVQHVIDFVLALVRVDFLLLSWFQAINVAEKILRLEEVDLPHLFAGKLRRRKNVFNIHFALLRKISSYSRLQAEGSDADPFRGVKRWRPRGGR